MTKFAVFYGNRGFMPGEVVLEARREMPKAIRDTGFECIELPAGATKFGGVDCVQEARLYAEFLKKNRGDFDGVIVCLPNFSDESGTVEALRDCGVPLLIQAYPDEIGKMDFAHRRDAFCGKLAITDIFHQYGIPFSLTGSHVIHPGADAFKKELQKFAAVCRIVKAFSNLTVVAVGARTSAFKSMRFDELTAQKYGVTVETVDLSDFFLRMKDIGTDSEPFLQRLDYYRQYGEASNVPSASMENLVRASLAADEIAGEYGTDCMTIRCWNEFQREMKISACTLISELNDRGIVTACELDIANAISMKALSAASGEAATCLDFNNNYGDDPDKCILFHCGPVPRSLMKDKGEIAEHKMFKKTMGPDVSWGVYQGAVKPCDATISSLKTENGQLHAFAAQGRITDDSIEEEFFGTGGVFHTQNLQQKMYAIAKNGYRHHVSLSTGHYEAALLEAYQTYLGIKVTPLV